MERTSWPRVIGAGVLSAIIGMVIHMLGAFATMGLYMDPAYFQVWSKLMMPTAGPPPTTFYYYSIGFGIISGILLAFVYAVVRTGIPGVGTKRGIVYGLLVFLVAGIPGSLSELLLVNLPAVLIAYWAVESLVVYLIDGAVFGRLIS